METIMSVLLLGAIVAGIVWRFADGTAKVIAVSILFFTDIVLAVIFIVRADALLAALMAFAAGILIGSFIKDS